MLVFCRVYLRNRSGLVYFIDTAGTKINLTDLAPGTSHTVSLATKSTIVPRLLDTYNYELQPRFTFTSGECTM